MSLFPVLEIDIVNIRHVEEHPEPLAPCQPVQLTVRGVQQGSVDVLPIDCRLGSDRVADVASVDVSWPSHAGVTDKMHWH